MNIITFNGGNPLTLRNIIHVRHISRVATLTYAKKAFGDEVKSAPHGASVILAGTDVAENAEISAAATKGEFTHNCLSGF
jgi:hypothetical protein